MSQKTVPAGREAQIQTLAPICQIAREADIDTMSLLEGILVDTHGREVVTDAWKRAEQNARPTEKTEVQETEPGQ